MFIFKQTKISFYATTLLSISSSLSLFGAITGTWGINSGTWPNSSNWMGVAPTDYPGKTAGGGDVAILPTPTSMGDIQCMNGNILSTMTLGRIEYNNTMPGFNFMSSNLYTFYSGNPSSSAQININTAERLILGAQSSPPGSGKITLDSDLIVNVVSGGTFRFQTNVELIGSGSLTFNGEPGAQLEMAHPNTSTGLYTMNGGKVFPGSSTPGAIFPVDLVVTNGGVVDCQNLSTSNQFAITSNVFLNNGALDIHMLNLQECNSLTITQNGSATGQGPGKLTASKNLFKSTYIERQYANQAVLLTIYALESHQ